jgi:hypothetical protein
MGLVVAAIFKPLVFVLFVGSLVGISMRRARDAGLPAFAGLLIPLMLAADYKFGVFAAAPWSFAFSFGVLGRSAPIYLGFGLICLVLLGLAPSARPWTPNAWRSARPESLALSVIAALLVVGAVFSTLMSLPDFSSAAWRFKDSAGFWMISRVTRYTLYLMLAFVALAAYAIVRERRSPHQPLDAAEPIHEPERTTAPKNSNPSGPLIVGIGIVLTLISVSIALGDMGRDPIAIAINLVPIYLPTFALYTTAVWAIWRLVEGPGILRGLIAIATLVPFALWAQAYFATSERHASELQELAALQKSAPPDRLPSTLLFESRQTGPFEKIRDATGVEHVIIKGAYGQGLASYVGREGGGGVVEGGSLPAEYLHLIVGRDSALAKPRQMYGAAGGPMELRYVTPSGSVLIGAWYRAFDPAPSVPPVLTLRGWFRDRNTATTKQVDDAVVAFLYHTLGTRHRRSAAL